MSSTASDLHFFVYLYRGAFLAAILQTLGSRPRVLRARGIKLASSGENQKEMENSGVKTAPWAPGYEGIFVPGPGIALFREY
jgi:hypothetical protein